MRLTSRLIALAVLIAVAAFYKSSFSGWLCQPLRRWLYARIRILYGRDEPSQPGSVRSKTDEMLMQVQPVYGGTAGKLVRTPRGVLKLSSFHAPNLSGPTL